MANIIKHLDAILAAYDLRTAKNMQRIQKGKQPKIKEWGNVEKIHVGEARDIQDRARLRLDEHLYHGLEQIQPIITILDQFKYKRVLNLVDKIMPSIQDKIAKLQQQIESLKVRLNKLHVKEVNIYRKIEEDYYKEKYHKDRFDGDYLIYINKTAKAIAFAKWGNDELVQLVNEGKVESRNAVQWLEDKWNEMQRQDYYKVRDLVESSDVMREFLAKYSGIMDNLKQKINELTTQVYECEKEYDELSRNFWSTSDKELVDVKAEPQFNVKDVSEAYAELFSKFPSNKTKQRIYPEELTFNLMDYQADFNKSEFYKSWNYKRDEIFDSISWNKRVIIVISRAAYDIVGRDTDRIYSPDHDFTDIKSDHNNSNQSLMPLVVQKGYMIAYLCYEDDKNINNPLGAIFIVPHLPYENDHPDSETLNGYNILTAEFVSGFFPEELVNKLQDFLNKNWNATHHREIGKAYHRPSFGRAGEFFNWNILHNVGYDEDEGIVDPTSWRYRESRNIPLDYDENA